MRRESEGLQLASEGAGRVHPLVLDVTQPETIETAAARVRDIVGSNGLQGPVNNAGIGVSGPIEYLPIDALRRAFEVNLLGQVAVTQAFLPLIRSGHGRIVNVGSVGGSLALPFASPICSTKSAFESLSDSLRLELRPWRIPVIVIAPGSIRTPAVVRYA